MTVHVHTYEYYDQVELRPIYIMGIGLDNTPCALGHNYCIQEAGDDPKNVATCLQVLSNETSAAIDIIGHTHKYVQVTGDSIYKPPALSHALLYLANENTMDRCPSGHDRCLDAGSFHPWLTSFSLVEGETGQAISNEDGTHYHEYQTPGRLLNRYLVNGFETCPAGHEFCQKTLFGYRQSALYYGTFMRDSSDDQAPAEKVTQVTTDPVTDKNANAGTATLNGTLVEDGGFETTCYLEYGETQEYGTETEPVVKAEGESFSANISDLDKTKIYHCRAVAQNAEGYAYGADIEFSLADVLTLDVLIFSDSWALVRGQLLARPATAAYCGFEVWPTDQPALTKTQWYNPPGGSTIVTEPQVFMANLGGLKKGTSYTFRAMAQIDGDMAYGENLIFDIPADPPPVFGQGEGFGYVDARSAIGTVAKQSVGRAFVEDEDFAYESRHAREA